MGGLARKCKDWWTKLATKHEDQKAMMAEKHEEWWARMEEEVDAMFSEVFSKTSSIDSVRLLSWCISTTTNLGALLTCYLSEALATTMQWRVEVLLAATAPESGGPQAQFSMKSLACQTETPPLPILPLSNIPLLGTPLVGCSPLQVHDNGICASGSTEEHNSEDNTDHSGDKSTQEKLRENAADSDLELAWGDCLTCTDMEEVVARMARKRLQKRVQAPCSIVRGCLWSEAQLRWIKDSHQAIWDSGHEVIQTEWLITLEEDHTSFEVNRMTIQTKQLILIKEATHSKVHTWESEAEVHDQKKALVQSLKQFHACFYQLYEKGTTWAMVSLQGLHASDLFRCINVLVGVGIKSFCLWCLKLGGNTETIAIYLREVYYRMAVVCNICQSFTGMNTQHVLDHYSNYKAKCDREHAEQGEQEKAKKSHKKKSKSLGGKETF